MSPARLERATYGFEVRLGVRSNQLTPKGFPRLSIRPVGKGWASVAQIPFLLLCGHVLDTARDPYGLHIDRRFHLGPIEWM